MTQSFPPPDFAVHPHAPVVHCETVFLNKQHQLKQLTPKNFWHSHKNLFSTCFVVVFLRHLLQNNLVPVCSLHSSITKEHPAFFNTSETFFMHFSGSANVHHMPFFAHTHIEHLHSFDFPSAKFQCCLKSIVSKVF